MQRIVTGAKPHRVAHPARAPVVLAIALLMLAGSSWPNTTLASTGPMAVAPLASLPPPRDQPFHGAMTLAVTATDTDHQIFVMHETIPVQHPGDMVLLYPQWETGSHAPTVSAIELTGLVVHIDGHRTAWHRDPTHSHSFRINVPNGAQTIALDFQFLAPQRAALLRTDMVDVQWQRLLLYPAGWYVRDIPVDASVTLAPGMQVFTALTTGRHDGPLFTFSRTTLDKLVDAPVYAGRYRRQFMLSTETAAPVRLDVLADAPSDLVVAQSDLSKLRLLVAQTLKVFGAAPYRHYDALLSLSDELSPGGGIEHLEEGENNMPADYFTDSAAQLNNKDLIAHELVHAWNGRSRQPAGLWSADFNTPVDGSLLWVYEGQTEFWGRVLAARAGLRSRQQILDKLALDAALVAHRRGRAWKTLADSANDASYMAGHHVAWRDWQRREDYYPEGVLLWLDVDARLRQLSHGKRSLDDFAQRFFSARGEQGVISTYTFQDICAVLNAVAANDWTNFLQRHLDTHDDAEATAGLARAGWQLVYTDTPSETFRQDEADAGVSNLDYSIGLQVQPDGVASSVVWEGPAFRAGIAPGTRIKAVDGNPFSLAAINAAVKRAGDVPITLTFINDGRIRTASLTYRGTLHYPSLQRIPGTPDRLSSLLDAR
ncbi:M61 family metallopeptidase [Rhodanobacter soli]|uniref:Metalloprotease with PDZ domain n=1 Tax=Rhodanobacter soli TaxID=590609 RepID=A0ABV2PS02_9GAMM